MAPWMAHTQRHPSGPHHPGDPRARSVPTTIPTPMPEFTTPMTTPRRLGATMDPTIPGAGTQMAAPPTPQKSIPSTSWGTPCAVARTTIPTVELARPALSSVVPATRTDSAITSSAPSR